MLVYTKHSVEQQMEQNLQKIRNHVNTNFFKNCYFSCQITKKKKDYSPRKSVYSMKTSTLIQATYVLNYVNVVRRPIWADKNLLLNCQNSNKLMEFLVGIQTQLST